MGERRERTEREGREREMFPRWLRRERWENPSLKVEKNIKPKESRMSARK